MPIYDFECKKCGKTKEVLQSINDPAPLCDDEAHGEMSKQITLTASVRKGAGLYSLDISKQVSKLGDVK